MVEETKDEEKTENRRTEGENIPGDTNEIRVDLLGPTKRVES